MLVVILNIFCAICWSVNAAISRDRGNIALYTGLSILWWIIAIMNIFNYLV